MLVINDLHLGVVRSGGTTPASQAALRNYALSSLESLLADHGGEHVVVNGDLFDSFQVDTATVIAAHKVFSKFISAGGRVTLIMGNHDASMKGDRVSSFHLLAHILQASNKGMCKSLTTPTVSPMLMRTSTPSATA
jgi:metallophosphoesterase superfamily enzyme